MLHRGDIFTHLDCSSQLLVQFLLIKLLEVVVVHDFDHLAAEANPFVWKSALQNILDVFGVCFLENNGSHDVASVGYLIVPNIFVSGVHRLKTKDYSDEKVHQVVQKDECNDAEERTDRHAKSYADTHLKH